MDLNCPDCTLAEGVLVLCDTHETMVERSGELLLTACLIALAYIRHPGQETPEKRQDVIDTLTSTIRRATRGSRLHN